MEPGEMKYGVPNVVLRHHPDSRTCFRAWRRCRNTLGMPRQRAITTRRPCFRTVAKVIVSPGQP